MCKFDLEQRIMEAWNTSDDINSLVAAYRKENITFEELLEGLDGLAVIVAVRGQRAFEAFENCL